MADKHKPIVGLVGGIGSGKSFVSREMAARGGRVINADADARAALLRPDVRDRLVEIFGQDLLTEEGQVNRGRLADLIFDNERNRQIVESIVHPIVAARRAEQIAEAGADDAARFIVLDVPLLFEVRLNEQCDRIVFVKTDREKRLQRLADSRGWTEQELARREKNQMPLDKKLEMADDVVDNNAGEDESRAQIDTIVQHILNPS